MTVATPTGVSDAALAAARELAPEVSARAQETEQLGTVPADLVARIRAAGLFRIAQPRSLGGMELPPATLIDVLSELCRADASTGWTTLIGVGGNAFAGWLDPDVAHELLGENADITVATVFAPTGRAVPDGEDGFRVEGRWPFASGCRHAEWFLNGVFVMDGDTPRILPGIGPDWRLAYFPRVDGEIVDDWNVIGLRGTGSNDVRAEDVAVPAEHLISPFHQPARHDGPLWRLPFFTLSGVALAAFPLGVGRRALDELTELAGGKTRAGTFEPLAKDAVVQIKLAHAEGALQAAQSFVYESVGSMWDTACRGDVPSVQQRATFQLSAQVAMQAAITAVDTAYTAAGSTAIQDTHPLQRCFRDVHTAAQHAYFSPAALKRYALTRLGIDQPLFML